MSTRTEYPPAEGIIISGRTLRRNYLYQHRKDYLVNNSFPSPEHEAIAMKEWQRDARNLYPDEGDYQNIDNVITYMGKF